MAGGRAAARAPACCTYVRTYTGCSANSDKIFTGERFEDRIPVKATYG